MVEKRVAIWAMGMLLPADDSPRASATGPGECRQIHKNSLLIIVTSSFVLLNGDAISHSIRERQFSVSDRNNFHRKQRTTFMNIKRRPSTSTSRIAHFLSRRRLQYESLEHRRLLTTLSVTNTDDSGAGSLRQAISDANATAGHDTITFDIPGSGPHTISPLTPLPKKVDWRQVVCYR